MRRWTPEEDAKLRSICEGKILKKGQFIRAVDGLFPGRPIRAIYQRVGRLKIKMSSKAWKPQEDRKLMLLWGEYPMEKLAEVFRRTPKAIQLRASTLKLPIGCPSGWEYLSHAAKRTGFATITLRLILKKAEVHLRREYTLRSGKRRPRPKRDSRRWIVEPDLVDDAVALYCAEETPESAAKRRGTSRETLMLILAAAGIYPPPKGKKRKAWRLPSADIDRAIELREERKRNGGTLIEAAARHGMLAETLGKHLRKLGFKYQRTYVLYSEVDRCLKMWAEREQEKLKAKQQRYQEERQRKAALRKAERIRRECRAQENPAVRLIIKKLHQRDRREKLRAARRECRKHENPSVRRIFNRLRQRARQKLKATGVVTLYGRAELSSVSLLLL